MGDYAGYILAAYGLSALALGGLTIWSLIALRRARQALAAAKAAPAAPVPAGD